VEENLQEALKDATRNFLRGTQLKEAVNGLWKGPVAAAGAAGDAKRQNGPNAEKP
jgi:ribosomal protein L12E/L44/L45/RPP1/RPP2